MRASSRWRARARAATSGCRIFSRSNLPPEHFHGVFANASLFHVPSEHLPRVLADLRATLARGGVLFFSNPRGAGEEGWSGERYGCYFDVERWRALLIERRVSGSRLLLPSGGTPAQRAAMARDDVATRLARERVVQDPRDAIDRVGSRGGVRAQRCGVRGRRRDVVLRVRAHRRIVEVVKRIGVDDDLGRHRAHGRGQRALRTARPGPVVARANQHVQRRERWCPVAACQRAATVRIERDRDAEFMRSSCGRARVCAAIAASVVIAPFDQPKISSCPRGPKLSGISTM